MFDLITLSCPNCGGKLEITPDIERFACGHCGREHIVKRSGGIVALSPVVDAIKKVEVGVNKTASELALARLDRDIRELQAQRAQVLAGMPEPGATLLIIGGLSGFFGLALLFIGWSYSTWSDIDWRGMLIFGVLAFLVGIGLAYLNFSGHAGWERRLREALEPYNAAIAAKQKEAEQHRRLVSS